MANTGQALETIGLTDLGSLRRSWGWFVGIGVGLMILGLIAGGAAVTTTVASLMVFGWLLVIGAVMEIAFSFYERTWGGMFVDLLMGVLYGVVGFMMLANPAASAVTLTLLIAMFLIIGGIFRLVAAATTRYPSRGWLALHGVLALILGVLIWQQWPASGLWVIGLFIGIELFFNGLTLLMLGMAVHRIPEEEVDKAA